MSTLRLRWIVPRLLDPAFHRKLSDQLENPAMFYWAVLAKLWPNLHKTPLRLKLKDGKVIFIASWMTLYFFEEIFLDEIYDAGLEEVRSIVDIGANIGLFVVHAKQRWPHATILAFEPEPENYAGLRRTIEVNGLRDVTAVNAAVAAERGSATLYRHPRNVGGHSIVRRQSADTVEVVCQTLADALAALPNGTCDLLKVDCEGAEEAIFRNLTPDVANRIRTIAYEPEWGQYSVDDLNDWLKTFGYSIRYAKGAVIAQRP